METTAALADRCEDCKQCLFIKKQYGGLPHQELATSKVKLLIPDSAAQLIQERIKRKSAVATIYKTLEKEKSLSPKQLELGSEKLRHL